MNWYRLIDGFGRQLLSHLGEDPNDLPTDHNPVTRALQDPDFVSNYDHIPGFNRIALSRLATICQMIVFDEQGGPEGDDQPKALRRHWYSWYKVDFAQPLAQQLGDFKTNGSGVQVMNDLAWSARLSVTYAAFVDNNDVTYTDLWVEDASRMIERIGQRLFRKCHIIVAVEKDSLFGDFQAAAKALGARAVYSGKGKSSKAAIEKLLRETFGWSEGYDPFRDDPLIILHISDYDYDGEQVIGPCFADQAHRYVDNILEARVGVQPENVIDKGHDPTEKWYQVKIGNKGYQDWARHSAMFLATCWQGHQFPVVAAHNQYDGLDHECPHCGTPANLIKIGDDTAYGFEVEALRTRDYYSLLVYALLKVLDFEYILEQLRDECMADVYDAAQKVLQDVLDNNDSYIALLEEFDRLEEIKQKFERDVQETLINAGQPHQNDWWDEEDDPEVQDFVDYVVQSNDWSGAWRPFSTQVRTDKLTEWLEENEEDTIRDFINYTITW